MHTKIIKSIDKFFHDSTISELRIQNSITPKDGKLTYNDMLYLSIKISDTLMNKYTGKEILTFCNIMKELGDIFLNEVKEWTKSNLVLCQ